MKQIILILTAILGFSFFAHAENEPQQIPEASANFYIDLADAHTTDVFPEFNRPYPNRRCTVYFQQCQVEVFGRCMRWRSRTMYVAQRDARYACYYADRQYGPIRRCRVSCNR